MPRTYSGSSARADYRRRPELNTQDSDEDVLFRREMNYPEKGAGGFSGLDEPVQGRAEDLRLHSNWTSRSMRQRPRPAQREVEGDTEITRMRGPALAMRTRVEASTRRTRTHRSDRHPGEGRACINPGEIRERARPPRRSWGSGWRRSRA